MHPLLIEQVLQSPDVFDTLLNFQEGDVLEVVMFTPPNGVQELYYQFSNSQWHYNSNQFVSVTTIKSGKIHLYS